MLRPTANNLTEKVNHHSVKWLRSRYAGLMLAVISFGESVIVPIIIDPFLVAVILAQRARWLYFTTISIVSSIAGGMAGYLLGFLFFNLIGQFIIDFYGLHDQMLSMTAKLDQDAFVFVLIGALTPVPYKLVAIASGLTKLNILVFFFASLFGRTLRLGLVGGAAYRFGPKALPIVRQNLLSLAYVVGVILIVYISLRFFI